MNGIALDDLDRMRSKKARKRVKDVRASLTSLDMIWLAVNLC